MNVSKYCADPQKKGAREQQTEAEKSRQARRPKRRPSRIVFISFLVVLVTIILVGLALIIPMLNKGARHTVIIKIPANATSKQVEDSVSKYLGSDYAHDLRQAMEITGAGAPIRYGAFRIEKGQSPMQGARTITHGGQVGIRVVIQNERDKKTLAKKFAAKLDMPVDSLMGVLNDSAFLEKCDTDRTCHVSVSGQYLRVFLDSLSGRSCAQNAPKLRCILDSRTSGQSRETTSITSRSGHPCIYS